jgi:hypothetical protein
MSRPGSHKACYMVAGNAMWLLVSAQEGILPVLRRAQGRTFYQWNNLRKFPHVYLGTMQRNSSTYVAKVRLPLSACSNAIIQPMLCVRLH